MTKELRPRTSRILGYLWGGACLSLLVIVGEDLHSCLTKPEAYPFGAENVSIIHRDLPTYVGANALLALWLVMGIVLAFFVRHGRRGILTLAHALITLGMLLVSALPE
mgnify:FL=1